MVQEYLCNCSRYCHNPPRKVSKSTWNKHRPFREHDAASAQFQAFLANELNGHGLGETSRQSSCGGVPKTRKPRQNTQRDKGKGRETDDNDAEMNSVDPEQNLVIESLDWLEEVCMRPRI